MRKLSRRALLVAIGVVAAVLAIGVYSASRVYLTARAQLSESRCAGHENFEQSQWMDTTLARGTLAIRGCMVDDLLARHEFRGMSRAEVVALIGEPDREVIFAEYDLVYWLGPERGLIGTDFEYLVMKLDGANRVISFELRTG